MKTKRGPESQIGTSECQGGNLGGCNQSIGTPPTSSYDNAVCNPCAASINQCFTIGA